MLAWSEDRRELMELVAAAHGTTYEHLRPICYAMTRAVQRGHNISQYLTMLIDLEVITPEASRQFSEIYAVQHDSATTIARFWEMLRWGIDN